MSPERTNGQPEEEEYVAIPKMSVPGSPVAGTPVREAQSPISILLAVAQSHSQQATNKSDDDLTNLGWLQNRDLLKGMNLVSSPVSAQSTPVKYSYSCPLSDQSPTSDYIDDSSSIAESSSCSSLHSPLPSSTNSSSNPHTQQFSPNLNHTNNATASSNNLSNSHSNSKSNHNTTLNQSQQQQSLSSTVIQPSPTTTTLSSNSNNSNNNGVTPPQRNRHPHNMPYDPLIHTTNKPPYSFSCLIFMAIEDSNQKALPVKEIYAWIMDHFPYFNLAPTGWKNSVRHNLSLNKCFQKVEKAPNLGKGSLWTVDQQFRPNLLQALTRSPYHPCSTLDPSVYLNKIRPDRHINNNPNIPAANNTNHDSNNSSNNNNNTNVRISNNNNNNNSDNLLSVTCGVKQESCHDDSLDAADAAAVMLSLRNPTRNKFKRNMIITTSPSQDHTYSAADSYHGSNDEAFESDDDRIPKRNTCRKIDFEDEEERKIKEGAETLLNLAGITTRKRNNSLSYDYYPYKRIKEEVEEYEKPVQFRPRLLRKKKDSKKRNNNNNNNLLTEAADDWAKHRREIESQSRG